MTKLIIISGPSGVGKNTLVDAVLAGYPDIQYFKKVTTRDKRPDDRDAEARFLMQEDYEKINAEYGIALAYKVRGKDYGLPIESLAELKDDPRIVCLSDFDLIRSLRKAFDTTTVYVKAPINAIKQRLELRIDTDEQRKKSIEAVPKHLQDYEIFKELFDYEIINGEDLSAAKKEMIEVIEEELSPHRKKYSGFLLSKYGTGEHMSLPDPPTIAEKLKDIAKLTMSYELSNKGIYQFVGNSIAIKLLTYEDDERKKVFYGDLILEGPKKVVAKTGILLEELFPGLNEYGYKQERIE